MGPIWPRDHRYSAGKSRPIRNSDALEPTRQHQVTLFRGSLDTTMFFEGYRATAQKDFGVTAALCFYDNSDGMNAMAMPDAMFADGPDGTVLMGDNLTRLEWGREPIIPLFPFKFTIGGAWQSVEIIVAHEYAHILQYKKGFRPNGPWEMEPHADFMAGWLLGVKMERMIQFYGQDIGSFGIEEGARSMFQKGDTLFNDGEHHGEPQLRAAMVHGGFNARKEIQEAYVHGVSTRSVDDLVKAMGMTGISKSQVSRLCEEIDGRVKEFLNRPIEGSWPYVWISSSTIGFVPCTRATHTYTFVGVRDDELDAAKPTRRQGVKELRPEGLCFRGAESLA